MSQADIIQVEYETLADIAARFGKAARAHESDAGRLNAAAQNVRTSWQGRGASAFAATMESDVLPSLRRLVEALDEADRVTRHISVAFRSAEADAASLFDGRGLKATGEVPKERDPLKEAWENYWRSAEGQEMLRDLNLIWAFFVGSGHEFGEGYGAAAEIGGFFGDILSSFVLWGDLRDIFVEIFNGLHPDRDADELILVLALLGIILDVGWAIPAPDAIDGANLLVASWKAIIKKFRVLPPNRADLLRKFVRWGLKEPEKLDDILATLQWTFANQGTARGEAMLKAIERGGINPRWFDRTTEMHRWIQHNPDEFWALANDSARRLDPTTMNEARVAMGINAARPQEITGRLRRYNADIDFIDDAGVKWDVKSFSSHYPGTPFNIHDIETALNNQFSEGVNVILDTSDLSGPDLEELQRRIRKNGWENLIIFY